ncbi:MAG: hypothetical protein M3P24_10920 [Gemmatimonadota bacterium]|jgi:hypothetical protein|nr:hypothetical protein [Gemmatimonadota bacterium]
MAENKGPFEQFGETMGGLAGRVAGRATDMAMNVADSVFENVGRVLGGWWAGADAGQAARSFGAEQDRASREHHASRSGSSDAGRDYESARPLYQFGHVARHNPDYQGRSFRDVEPELERAWSGGPSERHGNWSEVRDYVEYGFDPHSTGGIA